MKKLITLLKQKWIEYILEIIVIFLGIFAAFSLDAWHEKNVEQDNLVAILKKSQLDIQANIARLERQVGHYREDLDTTLIALDLFEDPPEQASEEQDLIIKIALGSVMVLGSRNYDIETLNLLVESLPVTEANLDLIKAIDVLNNQITRESDLINRFHMHLFTKEAQLDKDIFWFDKNGSALYDYEALKVSRQTIDYVIRGYRWKTWAMHFENGMVEQYKVVAQLIDDRLTVLEN